MLRSECRPQRAEASFALPPKLLAVSLGIVMAACSADITRFDAPMFGLTGGSGNRTAAAPIPQENVWAGSRSRSSSDTAYDRGYRAPARERYAAVPPVQSRPLTRYEPGDSYRSRDTYQPAPSRPTYQAPPYRTAYEAPSRQPDIRPQQAPTPPRGPVYRTHPESRVAALPPQTMRNPAVGTPASRPAMRTAPARAVDRPAAVRSAPAASAHEIEVQPGDTLYGLAERHDVSISELMTMNALTSPVLRPGQRLVLPKGARMIAGTSRPSTEPAGAGATALVEPSTKVESQLVHAAERPSATETAAFNQDSSDYDSAGTYTIKRGDSLYGIAVREGVSLAELQRVNNIDDPTKVRAGTVLRLPSSGSSGSSSDRTVTKAPAAPRAIAQTGFDGRSQPAAPAAPAVEAVSGPTTEPVIINRPKRVASLGNPGTASDALLPSAVSPLEAERAPVPASSATDERTGSIAKFRWPVRGRVIAAFGKQPDGSQSEGIKLAVPVGTEVHAAESGVVVFAGSELKDYGNLVLLRHDDGWITAYAHNNELMVKRGDRVQRGQVIAKAGKSGNAETPQLHFEVRKGSSAVDPIPHLERI